MARSDGTFEVTIVTETGIVYEGRCQTLFVPSLKGQIAILAHHTPMIAKLSSGEVLVKAGRSREVVASITTGLLHVGENEATVLLDL